MHVRSGPSAEEIIIHVQGLHRPVRVLAEKRSIVGSPGSSSIVMVAKLNRSRTYFSPLPVFLLQSGAGFAPGHGYLALL